MKRFLIQSLVTLLIVFIGSMVFGVETPEVWGHPGWSVVILCGLYVLVGVFVTSIPVLLFALGGGLLLSIVTSLLGGTVDEISATSTLGAGCGMIFSSPLVFVINGFALWAIGTLSFCPSFVWWQSAVIAFVDTALWLSMTLGSMSASVRGEKNE